MKTKSAQGSLSVKGQTTKQAAVNFFFQLPPESNPDFPCGQLDQLKWFETENTYVRRQTL